MKALPLFILSTCIGLAFAAQQCCPDDEWILPRGFCNSTGMRINMQCENGHMLLKDVILAGDKVYTYDTGNFVFTEDPTQYCMGTMYRNDTSHQLGTTVVAVVCFQESFRSTNKELQVSGILTIISVFFLLATFGVYVFLPDLRDLQGICYMCMCISMALGFLSLGILQLSPGFRNEICTVTGFSVYFWLMATFFWMNVISINMYRTTVDAAYLKRTERKQRVLYNCYAWGMSLLFLVVALVTNFIEGDHYKPGIGSSSCWFSGRTETWIFFYGPIAILIASNVALFTLSSLALWKETRKYSDSKLNILKYKFLLSVKLFLVMGISWIFEILSFAYGESHVIWKIMDIFNCLQGLVIFLILVVLRRRAMVGLSSENCCLFLTKPLAQKLSPHDDSDDQLILNDDNTEVRLN